MGRTWVRQLFGSNFVSFSPLYSHISYSTVVRNGFLSTCLSKRDNVSRGGYFATGWSLSAWEVPDVKYGWELWSAAANEIDLSFFFVAPSPSTDTTRHTNIKEAPIPVVNYILTSQACCPALHAPCRSSSPLKRHGTQINPDPFFSS